MQKKNNEIILIRGVPGSGKTTKAKKEYPNHVLYEADQYFTDPNGNYVFDPKKIQDAHKWCQAKAKMSLNAGKNVVVANTFTRVWEMKPYLMMAKRLGCQVKVIEATGNYKNVHGVPEEKVKQMKERFEPFSSR